MLPEAVADYLRRVAEAQGVPEPEADTPLFEAGVLDSFGLLEFVSFLEGECHLAVADADLRPHTFRSPAAIEAFLARAHRA